MSAAEKLFPEGLVPYDFQINRALPWALARKRTYLALDPGLGKTICAALIINKLNLPTIYICPPFMLGNVELELKKWLIHAQVIERVGECKVGPDVLLVPDSILTRAEVLSEIANFSKGKNVILIVDEAHRFKSPTAKRTKSLLQKILPLSTRTIFLSGSPLPNGRPMELFPILATCAPETIGGRNFWDFGKYFCNGFEGTFGWDFSGRSNFIEFCQSIKRDFLLRIRKAEVLSDLPPKIESIVFIDHRLPKELAELERKVLAKYIPSELSEVIGDEHLTTYRKDLGFEKVLPTAKFVRDILTDSDESVLLFAIHKDAIARLTTELKDSDPLIITGSVDKDERFRRAQTFQKDNNRRLMILNIQAGGVGFNLTKATRVVFMEFDWVPEANVQAADRAHRIGQRDSVYVNYLVFKESLDSLMLTTILQKQKAINKI